MSNRDELQQAANRAAQQNSARREQADKRLTVVTALLAPTFEGWGASSDAQIHEIAQRACKAADIIIGECGK